MRTLARPTNRATGSGRCRAAVRDPPCPPRAARRVARDLVVELRPEQGSTERRLWRDTADARDLDGHPLALVVLDLDGRADADLPACGRLLLHEHSPVQPVANR